MPDPLDMTDKAVIVTGGCRGIGRGIAERFLDAGAGVVVCCRHEPESLPRGGDHDALFVAADVREPDGTLLAMAMHNAQTALRAGITTLRDCGSMRDTSLELRRAQRLGYTVLPRLHLCRCPMTVTGGHCWYFGGEADGPEGVRQMVRRLVKAGVDYIKIMASGGGTVGTISSRPC